jgi:hypothetical protein
MIKQETEELGIHDNKFNVTIIPFSYRKSPILSISFRSFDLEMQRFKIKIESDGDSNLKTPIISKLSETTMVPKFQIDYNNKEINYLNTTTYPKYIITLLSEDNVELMKFNLNLFELSFLGKDLYTVSINHFPILILEFMDGYYTTNELFRKNTIIDKRKTSNDIDNNLNIGSYLDSNNDIEKIDEEVSNSINDRNTCLATNRITENSVKKSSNDSQNNWVILEKEKKKKTMPRGSAYMDYEELKKAQIKEKLNNNKLEKEKEKEEKKLRSKKKNKKASKEMKEKKKVDICNFSDYFDLYLEKILYFRDELMRVKSDNSQKCNIDKSNDKLILYKRKEMVDQMKKEIEFKQNKNKEIDKLKEKIKIIIENKKNILMKLKENINVYMKKYEELDKKREEITYDLSRLQLLYDSLLYKKMAEICFVFFNKKCLIFFKEIPEFLKKSQLQGYVIATKRSDFYYDKETKRKISSMMGYITYMMLYMSKCFDIPLRYPLWLNGAKSFILKGKKDKEKDFLPLHCDVKKDDKYGNFEIGLNYLKNDFKEIINFCAMYPEIIPKDEYRKFIKQNDQNNNQFEPKDDLDKKMFFDYFIYFSHCLGEFVKNAQKMFES